VTRRVTKAIRSAIIGLVFMSAVLLSSKVVWIENPTVGRAVAQSTSTPTWSGLPVPQSPMIDFLGTNHQACCLVIPNDQETVVFSANTFAPTDPRYWQFGAPLMPPPEANEALLWSVLFAPAPITVQNTTSSPTDMYTNVYSDNGYSYQGRQTIPAKSFQIINFSTMMMGYIYGPNPPGTVGPGGVGTLLPQGAGMSLVVGFYPLASGIQVWWDTKGPTPYLPGLSRAYGGTVTLTPLWKPGT